MVVVDVQAILSATTGAVEAVLQLVLLLLWAPRTHGCMVPNLTPSKADTYSPPTCYRMSPLALQTCQVLLIISTALSLGHERLRLLKEPIDLLSLSSIRCHFTIYHPPLLLWTMLVLRSIPLPLVARLASALGLVRLVSILTL